MNERSLLAISRLVVYVLSPALYLAGITHQFLGDDLMVLSRVANTPWILDWTTAYWHLPDGGRLYRPLPLALWRIASIDGAWGSAIAHTMNIAVYVGLCAGVARLVLRQAEVQAIAVFAVAVFVVHPVHVDAVASIVGFAELIAVAASVWAIVGVLEKRATWWIATLAAVAYLSKESSFVLPGLIVATGVFERSDRRALFRYVVASIVPLVLVLGIRSYVIEGALGADLTTQYMEGGLAERVPTALTLGYHYARLAIAPIHLSTYYGPGAIDVVAWPLRGTYSTILVLLGTVMWAGFALVAFSSHPLRRFAAIFAIVGVLPISQWLIPIGTLLPERSLLLPSVGAAVLLAGMPVGFRSAYLRGAVMLASVLWVTALGVRTLVRVDDWRTIDTLLASHARFYPQSLRAVWYRAQIAQSEGNLETAAAAYDSAASMAPRHRALRVEAARALGLVGDTAGLVRLIGHSDERAGSRASNAAVIEGAIEGFLMHGAVERAEALVEAMQSAYPDLPQSFWAHARVNAFRCRIGDAEDAVRRGIELDPGAAQAGMDWLRSVAEKCSDPPAPRR